ncbi:MAG: helix-turn-helix domain-containing protein [Spirochaetales bacterium]|nr:helix-turn-helix domain-containing protein [Spirochaetales bacterium]
MKDSKNYVSSPSLSIGGTLQLYREDAELSRADLAAQLGVDTGLVTAWEENREVLPSSILEKLGKVFKVGHLVFT